MKNIYNKTIGISAALLTLSFSGCLNYQRPPLAVDHNSYTQLQEQEKTLLPENITSLTLEEAQQLALTNNPDFLSIRFSIESARARYYQQFSGYAPVINASMSISQSFNRIYASDDSGHSRSQRNNYAPGLSGQILLFDSLGREMNILNTRHALRQTEADVEDARRLLLRATAYAYNDVQLAYAQREIILAQIDYNQNMLSDAERKHKAGTVLLSDVLNFKVALNNAKLDLIKINNTIQSNLYVLAGCLGLTDGTIPDRIKFPPITMPSDDYTANVDIYLDQALANRPDLRAARERLEALRYAFYGTISKFGPTASGHFSLGYDHTSSINHAGSSSSHPWSSSGSFNYGLSINWNLFNGFADYYGTRIAATEVSASDYALYQIYLAVITDVRTAYENHRSSIEQAQLSAEICELTRQTRDLVENEYNAGTALVTRLNEAERDLVQAQNNLVSAVVNIANTRAQLEAAIYSFTPASNQNE